MKSVATLVLEVLLFFFFIHTFSVTRDLSDVSVPICLQCLGLDQEEVGSQELRGSTSPTWREGPQVLWPFCISLSGSITGT